MSRPMKDSCVEWIGEIPMDWELHKLKKIIKSPLQYGANETGEPFNETDPRYIRITDITPDNKLKSTGKLSLPESIARSYLLEDNDILFARSGATVGKTFLYKSEYGKSAFAGYLIKASILDSISAEYVFYYTLGYSYEKWKEQVFVQSTIQNIGADKYSNLQIPVPPNIEEQQQIVTFLDDKIYQIDSIIDNTKKSIVELKKYKQSLITEVITKGLNPDVKMKDSGIEWFGMIPEHCSIKKVKIVASKIGSGKTPRGGASVYSDEGILFLRSQNVYDSGLYLDEATYISEEIDEAMRSTRVFPNDVLLNITGASIGRCCVYPENLNRLANVNQHVCIIRPIINKIIPRFLTYFFNSSAGQSAIRYYQTGGNREGLNFEQIGNIRIPYYSIEEQQLITAFLDEKTAHIDSLIANKEKMVQELESYKKVMIYEYVTGKKEVE